MAVNDTFAANGITKVVLVTTKKGDLLLMRDFMGKRSVLDARHYAGVFAAVFAAVRHPDRVVTIEFTLDGYGWHLKATPNNGVDHDAAYTAFIAALEQPD